MPSLPSVFPFPFYFLIEAHRVVVSYRYSITDLPTQFYWRSQHSRYLLAASKPLLPVIEAYFFPLSEAQQPQNSDAGQQITYQISTQEPSGAIIDDIRQGQLRHQLNKISD
jgi:hypothetical protein